jgi:dienelactone hydrolase
MKRFFIAVSLLLSASQLHAALVAKEVSYTTGDATTLKGYLAYDDKFKGKRPAVLVVHEWWGHNSYARKRAEMLAGLGYVALAVDMYGDGKQAHHPDEAQKFSSEIANNMELGKARFMTAMELIKKEPMTDASRIGAIGYCFGGAVVLQMAREGVDLDGVVSFHGSLGTSRPAQVGAVKSRIMVAHGGADPFVAPEQLTGFMKEMEGAGAHYKFIIYSGAQHSFTNPDADEYGAQFKLPLKYNKQADVESWADMQKFFKEVFQ